MIIIGRKITEEFTKKHASSKKPLWIWEKAVKETDYNNFNELRKTFPSADYVNHRYTIFNIGGNKYRLVTEIEYHAKVVRIKCIWTHAQYSMKKNEEAIRRGTL